MSFAPQGTNYRALARAALAELDAPEPNPSPAQLMGGPLAFGESVVISTEDTRDPANAPTRRPHLVAACQGLQAHPSLRLHCSCGRGLTFLAIAALSTGVLVVSSHRRLPPKLRKGGSGDLATALRDDPTRPWSLIPWEAAMRDRLAGHRTAWQQAPAGPSVRELAPEGLVAMGVVGDTAKRQAFSCEGCGAVHVLLDVTLLRLVLQAIADGDRAVRIPKTWPSSPSRRVVRVENRGTALAWSTRHPRS